MEEKYEPEKEHNPPKGPLIHRVCVQCNNMFTVPAGEYEKKNCPACHKT